MTNVMQAVILIPIALILFAVLGSVAVGTIFNVTAANGTAESSGWDSGTIALWNLIPIIAIVAVFLTFLALVGLKVTGKL